MTGRSFEPAGRGLRGRLRVPGDKSISHRALILGALAEGRSTVSGLSDGADVAATRRAVEAFGAEVAPAGPGTLAVTGGRDRLGEPAGVVDVGNSGTAIRLLAGVATGIEGLTVLAGDASIGRRPMERVVDPLRLMGASVDGRAGGRLAPLVVRGGPLRGIEYEMPVASAQVKSALLLAGLTAEGPTTVIESEPTRAHTEQMLAACGADITADGGRVTVRASRLQPVQFEVPGDPSQAAFWVVAACITPGSDVTVENVYVGPRRAGFLDVLHRMGADLDVTPTGPDVADIRARSSDLTATDVAGGEIPGLIDEIPVLAVAAARAEGVSTFSGAAELRKKESDRVVTTVAALRALGAAAEELPDGLAVKGVGRPLAGGRVDSCLDHRVAMSAAVAAQGATAAVDVDGWESVATSYPGFERDLERCRAGR